MKGCLRVALCFLFAAAVSGMNMPLSLSQEEDTSMVSNVSGQVASVDQEKSLVVIKYLEDEENEIYNEATIYVDSSTAIENAYETISIANLVKGESIDVEYTTSEDGRKIATYIWVNTEQ